MAPAIGRPALDNGSCGSIPGDWVALPPQNIHLILTTNLEFSKWGGIFTDDQMAAAMIDRLVHHGHLLIFEGKSYRMEHALMRRHA